MKSRDVLLISHEFPPNSGGAGALAHDLVVGLLDRGLSVTLLTRRQRRKINHEDLTCLTIPYLPKVGFSIYWLAVRLLNPENFKMIVVNGIGGSVIACGMSPGHYSRCLVWLHGSEAENIFLKQRFPFTLKWLGNRYRRLVEDAGRVVAVSSDLEKKFRQASGISRRIDVVPGCIDLKLFQKCPIDLYETLSIPRGRKLMLSVSRLVEGKGYAKMLNLFYRLLEQGDEFHWVIVGDGDYRATLERDAVRMGVNDCITFVGAVPRGQLKEYYSSVDLFWLLSDFREAFPLVYLESMACGTPVIARNTGGCADLLGEGEFGLLVESDEEFFKVLRQEKYLDFEPGELQNYVMRFSVEGMVNEFIKNFRREDLPVVNTFG